jgi:phage FluMu gp28-like protein
LHPERFRRSEVPRLINTLLQQGVPATRWDVDGFNRFPFRFEISNLKYEIIWPPFFNQNPKSKIQNPKSKINMSAIFPSVDIDSEAILNTYFLPYQVSWILAEDPFHARKQQVFALAEKSVRIGWTFADAFKNVRKRLNFHNRDYLFATKDYPSALEYMHVAREFVGLFNLTKTIVSHGEEFLKLQPVDRSTVTQEIKMSYIKFDTGSRIIAFSAHPQAMAVYGGDVGLDEFAKHPNAELLWQTAQGRVTWGYDMAVWSSHEGDDTLFNQFAQQARLQCTAGVLACEFPGRPRPDSAPSNGPSSPSSPFSPSPSRNSQHETRPAHAASSIQHPEFDSPPIQNPKSKIQNPSSPWNLYFKVTITDAIDLGLLDIINDTRDTGLTPDQFIADCRARAGLEQIFQQSYMCNPVPGGASIVDWSAIERCRSDYQIERVHLESADITRLFGQFSPHSQSSRHSRIEQFLAEKFPLLLSAHSESSIKNPKSKIQNFRLGFDIAASGQGDLSVLYIDEARSNDLWLRALLTCRTEDWDFIKTVLFFFLEKLPRIRAAGDESGLGRQICWEAAAKFPWAFHKVNFASSKQDLGFTLMNQLSVAEKHFPKDHPDIAADFFALRKIHTGTKWLFTEGRNNHNPGSHCDIAWAAALATFAHTENDDFGIVGAAVAHETGWSDARGFHPYKS